MLRNATVRPGEPPRPSRGRPRKDGSPAQARTTTTSGHEATRDDPMPGSSDDHLRQPPTETDVIEQSIVMDSGTARASDDRAGFAVSGPQERDQRHTVEQIVDSAPGLPILDVPVPQMVGQLVDVLKIIVMSLPVVAEQVIEVPTILQDRIPRRTALRAGRNWRNSWLKCCEQRFQSSRGVSIFSSNV